MQQLTDEQVDIVLARINQDGVIDPGLQQGLLDHYCCFIEEAMNTRETGFEAAYQQAFMAITPNGSHEIQEELFFLLTFKKQTNMKRVIYGTGFVAAFLISMGFMFRNFHWPWANIMLFSGFGALIITLTALLANSAKYMKNYDAGYKIRIIAGFVAGVLISTGSMFKIQHYPTANIQTMLGMVVLNFVFLPLFFYQLYKQSIAKMS